MYHLTRLINAFHSIRQETPRELVKFSQQYEQALGGLLIMISPIAPLFASECWAKLLSVAGRVAANQTYFKWDADVLEQSWPQMDDVYKELLVIQVRSIYVPPPASADFGADFFNKKIHLYRFARSMMIESCSNAMKTLRIR